MGKYDWWKQKVEENRVVEPTRLVELIETNHDRDP